MTLVVLIIMIKILQIFSTNIIKLFNFGRTKYKVGNYAISLF